MEDLDIKAISNQIFGMSDAESNYENSLFEQEYNYMEDGNE